MPRRLKHRFLKDMLLIFFGTIYRVGFFIFMFVIRTWWEFSKPREYIVNGQTVYAFPGSRDLYSSNGIRVGVANDNMTEAVMDL